MSSKIMFFYTFIYFKLWCKIVHIWRSQVVEFFNRVRELAKLKGLSIDGLMEMVCDEEHKSPRDTYNGWRRRSCLPRADMAVKIANILGVSVEYLVTGDDFNPDVVFCAEYKKYSEMLEDIKLLSPANLRIIEGTVKAMAGKSK